MTYYTITKSQINGRVRWCIWRCDDIGQLIGNYPIANHYKTRAEAVTAARLLAGWRGKVI